MEQTAKVNTFFLIFKQNFRYFICSQISPKSKSDDDGHKRNSKAILIKMAIHQVLFSPCIGWELAWLRCWINNVNENLHQPDLLLNFVLIPVSKKSSLYSCYITIRHESGKWWQDDNILEINTITDQIP